MKPKLTAAQRAKAKRAVVANLRAEIRAFWMIGMRDVFDKDDPEWPEVERLLKVALKAVRGAR